MRFYLFIVQLTVV